jgi:uncharacterized coiled-coil protein SlyX
MNALVALLLSVLANTAPHVPEVIAGPDLVEGSKVVQAPISEVTVFSDRARVRRKAAVDLVAGAQTLRLPDLPGAVMMDTVRVGCSGGRVLRVEAVPVARERFTIEQVDGLIDRLELLTDRYTGLLAERRVGELELAMLSAISPRAPVAEQERVGKPLPPIAPGTWKAVLDFVQGRRASVRAHLRALDERRRVLGLELSKVQREVARHDLGAFTDRKLQVLAIVAAEPAGRAELTLEYFVPGASWWPTYDLTYLASQTRVNLRTAGLVRQATGEDWDGVTLHLSTAIPGQGIALPEMMTWALGEKKEFLPKAVAARMPAQAPRFAPPVASRTPGEAMRLAKVQVLQMRMAELDAMVSNQDYTVRLDELDRKVAQLKNKVLRSKSNLRLLKDSVLSDQVADLPVRVHAGRSEVQSEVDSYDEVELQTLSDKPSSSRRPPPRVMKRRVQRSRSTKGRKRGGRSGGGGKHAAQSVAMDMEYGVESAAPAPPMEGEARVVATSLSLFAQGHYRKPRFSDASLPAVVAGGLDYVYESPTRMDIPSSGEKIAVPLMVESYPATVFYEATPSLKTVAYLKAEVDNRGERPILAGPVNIFMGPDFAGQGRLVTTGPGGKLPLPLGADENIRLKRTVVPKTVTEGVFSKDELTTYQVTIEVGNYKSRPVRIAIFDQIPKSGHEDIEIEKGSIKPKPLKGPDVDGVLRWELSIPAGQTEKIEFRYTIERPENWQLTQ